MEEKNSSVSRSMQCLGYELEDSGFKSREARTIFFVLIRRGRIWGGGTASCAMSNVVLPQGSSGRNVMLTTHLPLVPEL